MDVLPPLQRLLIAYATPVRREWHALCWTLDMRLADVVRRASEPMIGAIRLAWWDEALVADDRSKGGGEPLVEQWRRTAPADAASGAETLIAGWRTLLEAETLSDEAILAHCEGRGAGLFRLLSAGGVGLQEPEEWDVAGTLWALWDLSGHVQNEATARRALALAAERARRLGKPVFDRDSRPLALAHDLATRDAMRGRLPKGGFAGRHYRRLIWRGLFA